MMLSKLDLCDQSGVGLLLRRVFVKVASVYIIESKGQDLAAGTDTRMPKTMLEPNAL